MPTTLERASRSAERLSEIKIPQLPLREHGLTSVPAIPLDFVGMIDQLSSSEASSSSANRPSRACPRR